jgi:hypothetical protein
MRQTIINSLDVLIWVFGGLVAIGAVIGGLAALAQGEMVGIAIIIGGLVYAVMIMGVFFLIIGIHNNTARTADAVEKLASR